MRPSLQAIDGRRYVDGVVGKLENRELESQELEQQVFVYSLVVVAHEVPDQLWLMLGKGYIKQFE